jgi:lauroyl/myristoyl acyltransferase
VDRIVTDYTAVLERWVRRAPEQYLWQHRRWKHQRPGTPPELGDPL